jgi:tRNA(Arg) A34 adenosine deaminase TadA
VVPGQLVNSRIAHAEINALAQLACPRGVSFQDHVLFTNVEPCCLCMGAALQTGVGVLHYAWRDPYAGAATSMVVRNPQISRRSFTVVGDLLGRILDIFVVAQLSMSVSSTSELTALTITLGSPDG